MTKAALCVHCTDIVSPRRAWETDRRWRWCECEHTGVRWRDGRRGLLEVTSLHGPDGVRVIGINNGFLTAAVAAGGMMAAQWRELHDLSCARVGDGYLFHQRHRNCWALVVAVGESGDVTYVPYPVATAPAEGGGILVVDPEEMAAYHRDQATSPASSTDRAPAS